MGLPVARCLAVDVIGESWAKVAYDTDPCDWSGADNVTVPLWLFG